MGGAAYAVPPFIWFFYFFRKGNTITNRTREDGYCGIKE